MRRTKSPRQALERLAAFLGVDLIPVGSSRWHLVMPLAEAPTEPPTYGRTTNRALAFLADYARRGRRDLGKVQAAVRYYGPPDLSGCKGWEADALAWLTEAETLRWFTGR